MTTANNIFVIVRSRFIIVDERFALDLEICFHVYSFFIFFHQTFEYAEQDLIFVAFVSFVPPFRNLRTSEIYKYFVEKTQK